MSRVHRTLRPAHRFIAPGATALLALALAACGGGDGGGGPDGGSPSRIELVGTVPATAVNGTVTPAPSVKVSDDAGRAVANVAVTFTANGGGAMTGGSQRTNAQGIATVGSWKLGTVAGSGNSLTATAGSLTTTISAVATAGPASAHIRAAGQPDSQTVAPSTAVAIAPAVKVTDQYGNPIQGVIVTFAPSTGSGTVTGGLQTTNAQGIATVGSWTVSSTTGRQTLVASASGGLPPVTFVARVGASANTCPVTAYTLLAVVNASLATTDCAFTDGPFLDTYRITATTAINHEIRLASNTIDTYLYLTTPGGNELYALVDDIDSTTTNSALRFIAPPGQYDLLASSYDIGELGPYTLSSVNTPIPPGCSFDTWVVAGASWAESVASTDCQEPAGAGGTTRGDEYNLVLYPGRSAIVTLRSAAFDAFLGILRSTNTGLVVYATDNNSAGGTDARVTITNTTGSPTLYIIVATTNVAATSGAYTIDVAPTGAPATVRALAAGAPTVQARDALRGRTKAGATALHARAPLARWR